MTLSSFLLRPAETSVISGVVTDSIITSSPAILLGFSAGGICNTLEFIYKFTIKNGNTVLFENVANTAYPASGLNQLPNGIDCPNGIKVTTAKRVAADNNEYSTNARLTINYILK